MLDPISPGGSLQVPPVLVLPLYCNNKLYICSRLIQITDSGEKHILPFLSFLHFYVVPLPNLVPSLLRVTCAVILVVTFAGIVATYDPCLYPAGPFEKHCSPAP